MKFLWKPIVRAALSILIRKLKTIPDRQIKAIADTVNKKVDIPALNEEQEAKILYELLSAMVKSTGILIDELM